MHCASELQLRNEQVENKCIVITDGIDFGKEWITVASQYAMCSPRCGGVAITHRDFTPHLTQKHKQKSSAGALC